MNIALLKSNIYEEYNDINYKNYLPISTSYKFILLKQNGVYIKQPILQYNPHDTNIDISWAKHDNVLSQLKLNIPNIDYHENARLQIKVSSNFSNVNLLNKYYLTPIIYFDICEDVELLRKKYPDKYIVSSKDISLSIHSELVMYFKILISYITGIIDKLNIGEFDVVQNKNFEYVLNSTPKQLLYGIDSTGIIDRLIEEAKNYAKPIIIEV